ncbi:MAG: RdgB/HAM1 family non-canonical purine NTP pyrophosphatase [Spirochaetaceae bacterium]|nr:RdgB/HAM1 family non-canonical purine NTP pyrophosphatase [Spirochaetaceae bacterium]MDT8296672.1 RdgB/HAM1 family non-canonical purine NTP pyrophosphatase [Spirochaetaceae bacterium]
MEILLATGNAHKKEELERILAPHRILIPSDIRVEFDPDETGDTYLENALIKARALFESSGGRPVLADDSGLSVPAMKGAPGVYSARYGSDEAGRELESRERNALLIEKMQGFEGSRRQAFFVCCMVLIIDEYRVFTAQETFNGYITDEPSGRGGFGYDPIFFIPELQKTVAELDAGEKDRISHRGRAGLRIRALIDNLDAVQ